MSDTVLQLITNIAHLKCLVKDNEIRVDLYKATKTAKATKELVENIEQNNKLMREYLTEITNQMHILFD